MSKTLICTMGTPRSGKSIWSKTQRLKGIPVVCPDTIRLAVHGKLIDWSKEYIVWNTAKIMVKYFFEQGYGTVILDATNYNRKNRKSPKKWAEEIGDCKVVFKVFNTSREECIERAIADGREELIPVIEKQASMWSPLGEDEQEYLE